MTRSFLPAHPADSAGSPFAPPPSGTWKIAKSSPLALLPLLAALAACGDDPAGRAAAAERTCAAPVQLAVGESADLAADAEGRILCDLRAGADAGFVLAFVDTRATQKARTGAEGYGDAFPPYTVSMALAEDLGPGAALQRTADAAAPDFVLTQTSAPPPASAPLRETPWVLDERFGLYDRVARTERPARVLRVYDGRFAVAWFEGDGEALLPAFMARLDSAWAVMRAHALPLMRAAYSDELPVTSPGSGQYLLVLRAPGGGGAAGWTAAERSFGAPRIWTEVKVAQYESHLALAELMAHEMAHAFQAMYMYRTRPAGVTESYAGATFWGTEGGADLVLLETIRRAAAVPLTANLDGSAAQGASPALRRYVRWAHPGGGRLTDGYADAAGFLRRQAALLVQAGVAEDVAVGEVLRGASDGWFGYDHMGVRRTGLAARMETLLGAPWSPEDALLDWALAHAADDRTANPRFQDLTFLRASQMTGTLGSWQAVATLPGSPGAGMGMELPYGSPGFVWLHPGGDGPFVAKAGVPGVRWRILRVR